MKNLSQIKRDEMLAFLGKLRSANVDDETLLQINQIEEFINEKKYGLVWEKHIENVDEMLEHNIPIFKEYIDKKIVANKDDKYNFLLEGDNLHSLKLLEKTHKGEIDAIYIDPPYNTGEKDFQYNDNYIEKEDNFRHSKWLSFMKERLEIARELLSDRGFICISIDENEQAPLRMLCDKIFSDINYQSTIHTQVRYAEKSLTEEKAFKPVIEYVLIYSKNSEFFKPNREKEEYTDDKFQYRITELSKGEDFVVGNQKVTVFKKGEWKIEKLDEGFKEGLKETWISGTIYTKMSYGQVFQNVVEPRFEEDGLSCLYKVHGRGDDGLGYRYYTGPQRKTAKRGKMYSGIPLSRVEEMESEDGSYRLKPINTFYNFSADFGNINHEGGVTFNSGKKPTKMLKMLLNLCDNKNAIILDFFAGSGTTGHAVMQLNKDDGGNRKYILCTNNENNICEKITYQRLVNIQEELPHNLKYYTTEFIPKMKDDKTIKAQMLEKIKPLIELDYGLELDGVNFILIKDENTILDTLQNAKNDTTIFITSEMFLSQEESDVASRKNIKVIVIPEYYFKRELKEVGEL